MRVLYSEDLDQSQCQAPGCDHSAHSSDIYLHGKCHMSSHMVVHYQIQDGTLNIECGTCGKSVAKVAVASRKETVDEGSE